MEKVFKEIEKYLILTIVLLLPISVLGLSSNPFVITKLQILFYGVCIYLIIKSVRIITTGKLDFSTSPYDLAVLIIFTSYILSTIFRTPNKMEALLLPGTTTALVGGAFLYYFINQLDSKGKNLVAVTLAVSAAIFSILEVFAFSGLFSSLPLPAYIKSKSFTPEAGYLPSALFLLVVAIILAGTLLAEKQIVKKVLFGVFGFLIICGFTVSVYNLLPGKPGFPKFPSYSVSWSVAVDSLKGSPILGIGPGNYLTSFNRFRPISYNSSDIWAVKYTTANNFFLTALTEVGLMGFAGFVVLLYQIFKHAKADVKEKNLVNWGLAGVTNFIALIMLIVCLLLFPATNLLIILFFVLLALNSKSKATKLHLVAHSSEDPSNIGTKFSSRFPALLVSLPVMIAVGYLLFRSVNIIRADYKFKQSVDAFSKNQPKEVYDVMRSAILLNPMVDRYRSAFSRVNLLLANSVVQKKELTDDEKRSLTQLVQVAISEAKANVALNPLRSDNWAVLASTYRSVMPLAKGADDFAIQSYRQAIILDPLNPNLRIALGGVYYAKKDYDSAINVFKTVTDQVKRDSANAHYNLAIAYKDKGQVENAINEMTIVLSLVKKGTKDYDVAQKALTDLQSKKKEAAPVGEELNPPQPDQKVVNPPVDLPEGSEPPATPTITLTPTPTPITISSVTPTEAQPTPTLSQQP